MGTRAARTALRAGLVAVLVGTFGWLAPAQAQADTATFGGWVDASGTAIRWHTVIVGQVGEIRAVLGWDSPSADLNLFLQDPLRRTVASATSTWARPEQVSARATIMGTWWLGVRARTGAARYSLSVDYPGEIWSDLVASDRAGEAGIAQVTRSYGTFVQDFDLDGDQDFLYNRHGGLEMIFYANDGTGRFAQIFPGLFPRNDRHDCVWGDVNLDGLPDAYCSVGAGHPLYPPKVNELWLQTSEHGLERAVDAWGATDPLGRAREPALFDANGDGLLDLFVGNHYPRADGQPTPNRFFLQSPPGTFAAAPEYGIDREIGGQCAEPSDFDLDGDVDLAVCAHGPSIGLQLYRNEAGLTFVDVAAPLGIIGKWCDALWEDLNTDGRPDLAVMFRTLFQIYLQREDGTFEIAYQRGMDRSGCAFGGGGNRIASGDANGDGYPDLYLVYSGYSEGSYNLPDVFLVNDGTGRSFLRAAIPVTSEGSGQSVAAIQADGDPPTEFLVTNGRATLKGPIQLIDFGS